MRTPAARRVPQPHPFVERRVRAPAALGHLRGRRRTSGPRRTAASPTSTPTRRTCRAAAQRSRPLYDIRGNQSLLLWGPFAKSRYHSLQVAINRPFKNGLLLKGAYTLSRPRTRWTTTGGASWMWSAPSLRSRNYALAGYDRTARVQHGVRLRAAVQGVVGPEQGGRSRSWAIGRSTASTARCRALPFTITANGGAARHAGQPGRPRT